MTSLTHHMKRGDTSPSIRFTLSPPVNLSGATVVFSMSPAAGGAITVNRASAVIENAALGIVRYDWISGNTAVAGSFVAEFEVSNAGRVETYPNFGHINIAITPDIA